MRIVARDIDGAVKMEDHDASDRKAVRTEVVERYLADQTGLTQEILTRAWKSRLATGTLIAAYERELRLNNHLRPSSEIRDFYRIIHSRY
jgi:hypothetical protein